MDKRSVAWSLRILYTRIRIVPFLNGKNEDIISCDGKGEYMMLNIQKIVRAVVLTSFVATVTFFSWNGIGDAKTISKTKNGDKTQWRMQADKKRCLWFFPICLVKRSVDTK